MFAHFLFQIFAQGGADRVPLAVSSSIEATPTLGVYRGNHWYFSTLVLRSAGRSTTFALRRILQPPTGGRVHVSMYVNDQGLYICRYRPSLYNESYVQEERNPWVQFVCDSTHLPIIATHRSAHQDVQGLDGGISYTPASPRLRQGFIFTLLNLKRKWTMN